MTFHLRFDIYYVMEKVYIETSFISFLAGRHSMKNPIIEELWRAKDEIARECGNDLNKLADRLRKRQKESKHKVVNFSESQPQNPSVPN